MKVVKAKKSMKADDSPLRIDPSDWGRLRAIDHTEPHRVLGAHPATMDGESGVVVRAFHPDATGVDCLLDGGRTIALQAVEKEGLFGVFLKGKRVPLRYRLRFRFADGNVWECDDPYRFLPTVGEVDLHLFNEGSHRRVWETFGAHVT